MTIGIAAHGPNAGKAVLRALAAVEAVAHGAIGGFVSLVVIAGNGRIVRAEVQRGGTGALFPEAEGGVPVEIAEAMTAALMSSGPDRPEPLEQFTPGDAAAGLVTGHRMPNTIGASGVTLNEEVLGLMRGGVAPDGAVGQVVRANPEVDAGVLAITPDGRIGAANTAHVEKRGDAGKALLGSWEEGAIVAVLHNAIHPHRPIAALATEVAMDVMRPSDRPDDWITFNEGVALSFGSSNAVVVNGSGAVTAIVVDNPNFLTGQWSLGIGYQTPVQRESDPIAIMLYEPYMVVSDGRLRTIDGQESLSIPVRRVGAC